MSQAEVFVMRDSLLLLGYLFTLMLACGSAEDRPAGLALAFLAAVGNDDYSVQFEMDHRAQQRVAEFKKSKPKLLWEKAIAEQYDKYKAFKSDLSVGKPYQAMLRTKHEPVVLEVRNEMMTMSDFRQRSVDRVFVKVTYSDPLRSPILNLESGFIQSAVLELWVDTSLRRVGPVKVVTEAVEFWPVHPFRILSVGFLGDYPSWLRFTVNFVGGVPPLSVKAKCDGEFLEAASEKNSETTVRVTLPTSSPPSECLLTAIDSAGQSDSVRFESEGIELNACDNVLLQFWYGRMPWFSTGSWSSIYKRSSLPVGCAYPLLEIKD